MVIISRHTNKCQESIYVTQTVFKRHLLIYNQKYKIQSPDVQQEQLQQIYKELVMNVVYLWNLEFAECDD